LPLEVGGAIGVLSGSGEQVAHTMAPVDQDGEEEEEMQKAAKKYSGTRQRDIDFLLKSAKRDDVVELSSGLQYKVRRSGPASGKKPGLSTPCRVHYRGILTDGTEFDSTYSRGAPIILRPDQVVPGWREALQLMREGDRWEIILPSDLGYGERGAGPIPGGAVLVFELELFDIDAKESSLGQGGMVTLIGAIILFGMAMVAYLHFTRPAPTPRGPPMTPEDASGKGNPYVYFDMEVGGNPIGRIEFELFKSVVPRTAENFRALSTGEKGIGESGKPLHFKGTALHRIIPGFMCQGGDLTSGDGRGGESIYGRMFADEWEKGVIHHTQAGLLSMANRGQNTQSSQFFITTAQTSWLDGKHVVFGKVTRGMDIVHAIEEVGSRSGHPAHKVVIADCGELSGPYGQPVASPQGAAAQHANSL